MGLMNIGSIQKPHGIRGEVKVFLKTDFAKERFKKGNKLTLKLNGKEEILEVESSRMHKGSLLLKFVGLDNLNDVEFHHKGELYIEEGARHKLPKDEYYFSEIEGCNAYNSGELLGEITEMIDNPAHPIMRIKTQERDILVPFLKVFVKSVDLDSKRVDINWLEGL